MFIDVVPNGRSAPAVLLRESYREGGRVRKRSLANLGQLPPALLDGLRELLAGGAAVGRPGEALEIQRALLAGGAAVGRPGEALEIQRALLAGGAAVGRPGEALEIQRALPHGHVAAVLAMMRRLELPRLLGRTATRERELALALIANRVINPASKLATLRALAPETASSSLGQVLGLGAVEEREIYAALDRLGARQARLERQLARRHLRDGTLVLYDVSSSYLEGRCCPLARHGHSRDHRPDRPQIVYGLLCDRDGRPIAVEVFAGNSADPSTLGSQIDKLKRRFGLR